MRRESLSVIIACFSGAFVGALVALEMAVRFKYGHYFWSVGALLGGLVAYVIVSLHDFCSGIIEAYRRSVSEFKNAYNRFCNREADTLYWRATISAAIGSAVATFSCFTTSVIANVIARHLDHFAFGTVSGALDLGSVILMMFGMVGLIHLVFLLDEEHRQEYCQQDGERPLQYKRRCLEAVKNCRTLLIFGNPITLPFTAAVFLPIMLWAGLKHLWSHRGPYSKMAASVSRFVIGSIGRFFKYAFIYIHSRLRTLCFVDASIGATIGYFYGSAFLGAVVGAVIGVLNYEIVSVRLLKLPDSNST